MIEVRMTFEVDGMAFNISANVTPRTANAAVQAMIEMRSQVLRHGLNLAREAESA